MLTWSGELRRCFVLESWAKRGALCVHVRAVGSGVSVA